MTPERPPERRRPVARVGAPLAVGSGPLPDAALLAPLGMRAPGFLHALETSDGARKVQVWLDVGEALGAIQRWDRAKTAWERGLAYAEGRPETRSFAATFYWRLGQLAQGTLALADAIHWYERAADAFLKEGARADEAVARMALAAVVFHARGAGEARTHAREAVLAARDAIADDGRIGLLGDALEIAGEVALDLGHTEEAIASLREALRQHERAREAEGGTARSSDEVRAAVALAEALLDAGQVVPAVAAFEIAEPFIEAHDSIETRGRGMGVLALLNLELGRVDEATEPLKAAHDWLEQAGLTLRRARLHVATAQRVERRAGVEHARVHYERGWALASQVPDPLRLAPIGYALARCYGQLNEWVLADDVIESVLPLVQRAEDLDGLQRCTELAVRIALKLAQGRIALDRLLLLARTRGRMGDKVGEILSLRTALSASIAVPGLDPTQVATEFMECLRQTGTAALGPGEAIAVSHELAKAELFAAAAEIAIMEAERHVGEGRHQEGARTFNVAAIWFVRAGDKWAAVDAWDRAIDLGNMLGMADVKAWIKERTIANEGVVV